MGTRIVELFDREIERDHPHAYGDKEMQVNYGLGAEGSSPRVWGQVRRFHQSSDNTRIIPTRMGTRTGNDLCMFFGEDHPHAYGDK